MSQIEEPKVIALRTALENCEPFYSGVCALPDYQRLLYYTHGDHLRRVDFTNPGEDDLEGLYRACKPAEFGRNGENVLDESYRKAGKMDPVSFSTPFDPYNLQIHKEVSGALLTQRHVSMELHKLNVYGTGDFFKAHQDTPRGQDMFGSLVVVLPSAHEGGQFVLRLGEKEWTFDFSHKFGTMSEPSVCFIAFYGEVEHEVLPVTSGYRVTLTYTLYEEPVRPSTNPIFTPYHVQLKQSLVDLVNDRSTLPNGGYLGFGLAHEYVHTADTGIIGPGVLEPLAGQLKGSDRALADVCDTLGLRRSLRLFYPNITHEGLNFLSAKGLDALNRSMSFDAVPEHVLESALDELTVEQVEVVTFVGDGAEERVPFTPEIMEDMWGGSGRWLETFLRDPVTEVLEVTPMRSSVDLRSAYMLHGNEAQLEYFYGTACMMIAVGPAESRGL